MKQQLALATNPAPRPTDMLQQFIDQHTGQNKKRYLGHISSFETVSDRHYLLKDQSGAAVEVKTISPDIIRVRLAPDGEFLSDFSYAIQDEKPMPATSPVLQSNDQSITIGTESCRFEIDRHTGIIRFTDKQGTVFNKDHKALHWEENIEQGGYHVYCTKKAPHKEAYFGLGDKPWEHNLKGKKWEQWNSDMYAYERGRDPLYKAIPFYIGLHEGKAYGIFFDNSYRSTFDFGSEITEETSFWSPGGEMNYYYIHGPSFMDVVKRFAQLTGVHEMPPLWTLGFHQCRWSYFPESKVKDIAKAFRSKNIPCDAIYLDIDYMEGYRCFTWNNKHFPDPARMISELRQDGFRTVAIIDPGIKIDENYSVYTEARDKDYFCKRGDDYYMEGSVWPGRCRFPDFTRPEVREWWGGLFDTLMNEDGIAGIWNDMNEPSVFELGTFPDDVRHDYDGHPSSHRKAHNVYGSQMVRATYDGLKRVTPDKRPFTITRAAYAGVQRYSSTWTGDNVANWDHLLLTAQMCTRLCLSGLSFCGSDIGGFTGGDPDGELYVRWIQLGVFSPFMRVHSAGDTAEREPWVFGRYYEDLVRQFIEMRYHFLPYIYTTYRLHNKHGEPIMRPIALVEQHLHSNVGRQEEFMFGPDVLVAPVFKQGQTDKEAYLPAGRWYHYDSGFVYEGGDTRKVSAQLNEMPVFIRAGAILPQYPTVQHIGELDKMKELLLKAYYIKGSYETFLYEDAGEGFDYLKEQFAEKTFTYQGDDQKVMITQKIEGSYQANYKQYKIELIGLPFLPKKVTVDKRDETSFIYNEHSGTTTILTDNVFKELTVE